MHERVYAENTAMEGRKEARSNLDDAAVDGLTGLYNAQVCREKIARALSALKGGESAALLLMDIDHFKCINDTFGHTRADEALRGLAALLRANAEPEDVVGRFGGDEFLVCLRGGTGSEAAKRYTAFWNAIREKLLQREPPVTISTGVAVSAPGSQYQELLREADAALYTAKNRGRDCFVVSDRAAPDFESPVMNKPGRGRGASGLTGGKKASQWLMEPRYQTVLRSARTIAFDYDRETGLQHFSPFIGEYLAGNYDGRPLSQVMLEDDVIYPADRELSLLFLARTVEGESGEMTLRLRSASGEYRWFKMVLNPCPEAGKQVIVGTLADVDAEVRQKEVLRYRAEYDPVSGIYNKETFFSKTKALLDANPERRHFVIRFDIDRFKLVNEFYSVAEGDRVLRHVGEVISRLARPEETFGRFGSDVFCMCLFRSRTEVELLAEQLEQEINRYPMSFQFVLSVGIVEIPRYEGEPVSILCDRAALAQRTVKGNYVNRHAFYDQSMSAALSREQNITGSMRKALDEGEFQVWFQPKFDMRNGKMIGAESLVRWIRPSGEMISPGEFIPLFERNGFIMPLDEYVWETTSRDIRDWLDQGLEMIPISVNVSRLHLNDPEFCAKMIALSEKYRFPPHLLEMEITESAYTEYPQKLYGIMDQLQEHGFQFSMDDFGSGYSSLNVLKDIPVNVVKIDLNFLRESRRGPEAGRTVLEGTIKLVRSMGLPIIAEGVETAEQVQFLLNAGCTGAQGYYYARPMPEAAFLRLLREPGKIAQE